MPAFVGTTDSHLFGWHGRSLAPASVAETGGLTTAVLFAYAMAAFASWLVGMVYEPTGIDQWLAPYPSNRRLYSIIRLGREAPVRLRFNMRLNELSGLLHHPSATLLDQLGVPA